MSSKSANPVPEGVVNAAKYEEYLQALQDPILTAPYYTASTGEEFNYRQLPHYLKQQITHLPPKEQEVITDMMTRYRRAVQRVNVSKACAYGKSGRKLKEVETAEQQLKAKAQAALEHDIVALLGRMFSIAEVVRIMAVDNGLQVTQAQVKDVMARNLVTIERKREEFRNKVTDVRLYNKRPRLEELAWMYSKMKMRYVALNSTDAYNAMLRTLEQIRKEAEGDVINVNGAVDVNLNVELQAHIQKEIIRTINLKEIILGRVAARMNYDTTKLVAGLHNSYYNRFVQISGDFDENAELQYPSLVNYDFNEIERKNAQVDDVGALNAEAVTADEHVRAESVRALFLRKIREQTQQYEARTSTAVVEEEEKHPTAEEDYGTVHIENCGRSKKFHKRIQDRASDIKVKDNKNKKRNGENGEE